ncbi:MFS transporter [Actinoplanes sp. RD1]|uniref:MFS transporter n=1 Tax=Actinoplanes sp. RD1 TaxID=3064538 RepID=UPI002741DC98|nr:MFS transporter [Actinoplanes sp. RD1]
MPSRLLLPGLSLGYFLVLLDLTIVSVALPAIGADLHAGLSGLQWVTNGYTITFAALLLTAGRLADRLGAVRVFVGGLVAFGALSALTAAAGTLPVLVALRLALGVAGACVLPASLGILTAAWRDPAARARAVGAWAALTGLALVAGPVAGGILVETAGWRWIFLVNVPLAAAGVVLTVRSAPRTPPAAARGLDLTGQVAAVIALGALVYALVEGPVLAAGAVAVVAGAVFVAVERRAGDAALLPPALLRAPGVRPAVLAGLLATFGLSGLLFVLSLALQAERGWSALGTGLAFLPLTVPTVVNPPLTGRLTARFGPRRPATLGFLLMAGGAAVLAASTALAATLAGLLAFGTGVSFTLPALVAGVATAVPARYAGIGAGVLNSGRQVGAALGVAVLGLVPSRALLVLVGVLLAGAVVTTFGLRDGTLGHGRVTLGRERGSS